MLQLKVEGGELFDEGAEKFITVKPQTLQLEHSLVSISKWESKWKKPFLRKEEMTLEETIDYIRCMTISPQNINPETYKFITPDHVSQVMNYIQDPMTATTISKRQDKKGGQQQVITSEVVYYYMTAYQIPFDPCQKWHFNRLMTLIQTCEAKQSKGKKMTQSEINQRNRARNAARKAKHGTRG